MYITITRSTRKPIEALAIEIVERKGLGHPDTICDGVAEEIARGLTKFYYEEFGYPLHFNLDKAVLVGGRSSPRFGGGVLLEPIEIYIAGRATLSFFKNSQEVLTPIGSIIIKSIKEYIQRNFRFLNPDEHVTVSYRVRPGSADLVKTYERWKKEGVPIANDTSVGVGFAPLSTTEKACLKIENLLNSRPVKELMPAIGEDIKVMCIRKGNVIEATVAMATVDRFISDLSEYLELKEKVKELLEKEIAKEIGDRELVLRINTADEPESGIIYLTVTGTSAEAGDDGQIGRGNRPNGLITPMRPMSIEAPGGKNAVSHVGKIYQIAAQRAADRMIREVPELKEVYVFLVSRIGEPITKPQLAYIEYITDEEIDEGDLQGILEEALNELPRIWMEFMEGKIKTY